MRTNIIEPASLFTIASFLGLFGAANMLGTGEAAAMEGSFQLSHFIFGFAIATVAFLLLYKYKLDMLTKLWFRFALFATTFIFFSIFFTLIPALAIAGGLVAIHILVNNWHIRNAIFLFSFAGAGAFFGILLTPLTALAIIAIIGVYDVIAVRHLKHMLFLARRGIETETLPGFIYAKKGDEGDIAIEESSDTEVIEGETKQVGALGGGDVVFPVVFSVNLLKVFGPLAAITATGFSVLSLIALFLLAEEGISYPGIPFICSGTLLGFIVWFLLTLI